MTDDNDCRPITQRPINLGPDITRRLDDFRFDNRITSAAQALRVALEAGLDAVEGSTHG
jgi:hypothetical protein